MKNPLFADIQNDPDTRIIGHSFHHINDLNIKYENWIWDGVKADSYIFIKSELMDLSDEEIKGLLSNHFDVDPLISFTIRDQNQFKFFNCNFKLT